MRIFAKNLSEMNSIVAIVGRPNVGKSTLFNRLIQSRDAIVDSTSGVTRDRHYGKSDWNGKNFSVIDTGGYAVGSDDIFENEIRKQVIKSFLVYFAFFILFFNTAYQGQYRFKISFELVIPHFHFEIFFK